MTTPAELYRNAVDLNRFSNGVARRVALTYNDLVLEAVDRLRGIDELSAPAKAARLRAILAQLKGSLENWAGTSTLALTEDLQGLAVLQSEFVARELRRALPENLGRQIRDVQISPDFARSVATVDPTAINVVSLSDDLQAAVAGAPRTTFQLTAAQGTAITLPNGKVISKSFRGLAESQAELFARTVRNGLLTGESAEKIARRLKGRLRFGERASVKQLAQKGGEATAVANNQVMALVRTSVNQVANAASQRAYEANQDVTQRYRYVATLDGKTSAICRSLDGRVFEYGKGPTPPQHFNCRSTTVPIINYEALGIEPPKEGRRKATEGTVPGNLTYGQWLSRQSKADQTKILGNSPRRAAYFRKLSNKMGPTEAIRRFVKEDGSEVTLDYLRENYGNVKAPG
jgi:SPP1 gp7 family putative phage head morphogenesis protein